MLFMPAVVSPEIRACRHANESFEGEEQTVIKRDIWVILFLLGLLLFGWPLITIFRDNLAAYLFAAWAAFIVLIYLASVHENRGDGGN